MSAILWVRLALGAVALVLWLYGQQHENATLRTVAIVLLAVALVLRFVGPRGVRRP